MKEPLLSILVFFLRCKNRDILTMACSVIGVCLYSA